MLVGWFDLWDWVFFLVFVCFMAAFTCSQSVLHRLQCRQKSWLSISSASKLLFAVKEVFAHTSSTDSVSVLAAT